MNYEHIQVHADGEIAQVTLNRPNHLNALSTRMVQELRDFFGGLHSRSTARVVIARPLGLGMTKDALGLAVDANLLDAALAIEDRTIRK